MIEAPSGDWHLKVFRHAPAEFAAVCAAIDHLRQAGFTQLKPIQPTRSGEDAVIHGGALYFLTPWLRGSTLDPENVSQLGTASATLGMLHLAAKGFRPRDLEARHARRDWGGWPRKFLARLEELRVYRDMVSEWPEPTRFDKLFLRYVESAVSAGQRAVESLAASPYPVLVRQAEAESQLTHRDYIPSNLLCGPGGEFWVLDFDNCAREARIDDLAKFIARAALGDADRARFILEAYHGACPLSAEELQVIPIYLRFPMQFWRVSRRNYSGNREHVKALEAAIEHHTSCLNLAELLEVLPFADLKPIHRPQPTAAPPQAMLPPPEPPRTAPVRRRMVWRGFPPPLCTVESLGKGVAGRGRP